MCVMRCASCNVVLDPQRIAAGDLRCVCGVELDLPGVPPRRAATPPEPRPSTASAPELASYRSSPAAGVAPAPIVELATLGAELACPRCRETLSYAFQGSYDVHECKRCFGAFVDKSALATFIEGARETGTADVGVERTSGPTPDIAVDALARCPSCRIVMMRRVFGKRSGVLVDVCAEHGTWFDAGELAKALSFEAGGGAKRVERQEQDEAEQRKRDAIVGRERAVADAMLLQENVRDARTMGRLQARFEGREGLLDWLFGIR
jgi:Zn-finger nucleic acid-binding protein